MCVFVCAAGRRRGGSFPDSQLFLPPNGAVNLPIKNSCKDIGKMSCQDLSKNNMQRTCDFAPKFRHDLA